MVIHIPVSLTKTMCGKQIKRRVRSPVRPTEPDVCAACLDARRPSIKHAMFYGVEADDDK